MDVAIVGIGCRLPGGADTPERFWRLLLDGVDAVNEIPPDRSDLADIFDPDPAAPGKIYTRWGGFLEHVDRFDADFFGIAPREAKRMDPQHRLLLEVVWEALEDGGQLPERLAGTATGVFIGISTHDYGDLQMGPGHRAVLDAHVNIGNALCAAPNRLSYLLDLRGPSMAIETACSSSLTAVHLACRSLEHGESTLAIAGGVNLVLAPDLTIGFCKASMLSPDGRCRAFDARANGYVRSEGAGVLILKPLAQALSDGDPVYAVVRATAVNVDGRTAGISLPSADAQEQLLRQALLRAGVAASAVQYVEAHGTGTVVGDPAEAEAIGRVFGRERTGGGECLIGSVKTNVGHLEAGAGMVALIKTALMLRHRQIPPTLHFQHPNPAIAFDELRLRVPTALEPWPATTGPAMAGVNSFGFGGANAHAILEEAPAPASPLPDDDAPRAQVMTISARAEKGLQEAAERYRDHLLADPHLDLRDACYTAAVRRTHHDHRLAIVGDTAEELAHHLGAFADGRPSAVVAGRCMRGRQPKLAFVLAGMGTHWWGMGRGLLRDEPVFTATLEECDRIVRPMSGWSLLEELTADEDASRIDDTRVVQVLNCALQIGLAALWRFRGVVPDAVLGHSAGEVAAAHIAGALSLADALTVAFHRGRLLHRASGTGTMLAAAVSAREAAELAAASAGRVAVAAINSATSVTFSGAADALERIAERLESEDRFCRFLQVAVPYHGPQMDAIRDEVLAALQAVRPRPAELPIVSGVTGTWAGNERFDGAYWWRNIRQPVLFAPAVETLVDDGHHLFCEVGTHPVLSTYLTESLADRDIAGTVVPTMRRHEDERATMLRSLAALHVRGRAIDWAGVYPRGRCVPLPLYPWQRERHWFDPPEALPTRVGSDSGHPLLGRRLPSPHPCWEADLDDPRTGYLDAHVVEDSAVFPGACYVDMALAAARRLLRGTPITLTGVEFRRLLFLTQPRGRVLQLHHNERDASLTIYSAPRGTDSDWTLHATAELGPSSDTASTPRVDLAGLSLRCPDPVAVAAYYRTLEDYGFRYGSAFRGIETAWSGETEALARIAFPPDVELRTDAYEIHPALLDAALQLLVAAAASCARGNRAVGTLFPVSIRRVVFHKSPGKRFWAHVRVDEAAGGGIAGDMSLMDEAGSVALVCEGLRFDALGQPGSADEHPESWLYELGWEEVPRTSASTGRRLRPLGEVRDLLQLRDHPDDDPGVRTYRDEVAPALDRVAAAFARAALDVGGVDPGRDAPSPAAAQRLGVPARHHRLLETLINGLSQSTAEGDAPGSPADRAELHRQLDTLATTKPAFAAEIALLRKGGDHLAEVLRGTTDAREILLDDEGLELVGRLYDASPASRAYHTLLAEAVAAAVAGAARGATLRVIEVGAGTGAATAAVLDRLPADTEYVFTDVSPHFLSTARRRFGSRAGMRFDVLDVERDPGTQGFAEHAFDLVIAANVLHATADLHATLGHVRRLLRPGGLLALLELAHPSFWLNLVFGLLDGWWRFTDTDVRAAHPLLPADRWLSLLEASGFGQAIALQPANGAGHAVENVMLASVPDAGPAPAAFPPAGCRRWLLFADEGGTGASLAAELRAAGADCTLAVRGPAYRWRHDGVVELPPTDAPAFARVLQELGRGGGSPPGIVHLWSLDAPAGSQLGTVQVMESQRLGCGSVLALAQALDETAGAPPSVWLVTAGSQHVEGHDAAPGIAQAPLWGLGRVLRNETPTLGCRLVDLGPDCTSKELAGLVAELCGEGAEEEVALRNDQRYARRLRRMSLEPVPATTTSRQLRPDTATFRLEVDVPGSLESLALHETSLGEPGPGELEIRVVASGLNFRDVLVALGMLPAAALATGPGDEVLGVECSGVVLTCGPGVDEFRPGDEVIALAWGAHGSRVVTPAYLAVRKPPALPFLQAASVVNAFVTAEYALHDVARLAPGELVLIHSAAGAVGLAAIQHCQRVGAHVFATAGTPEKRDHLTSLGVEHVMDSRSLAFADEVRRRTGGEGVDVVLNSLDGEAMRESLGLLRPYGRFVELGKRDIYADGQLSLHAFRRNLTYTAVDLIQLALDRPETAKRLLERAVTNVADGTYTPVPCTAFDLADAVAAFRLMAQARHIGKIVLSVDASHYAVRPRRDEPLCRADGTYLVTGGLGGFGLAVAEWLVRQGARSLVLMSRSGTPADPGAHQALDVLRSSPADVHVWQGDAADEGSVGSVLHRIREHLPPLRGVVHAAMVLDDDALTRLDEERLLAVLAPKVAGAWNLHRLTQGAELDFFVLFSSIASVVGHPLQGNYAAANAFLDSLAAHRQALGLPGLTIGWGALTDVGYVARHPDLEEYLRRGGFEGFTPQQALDTLEVLIRRDRPYVIAGRVDWAKLVRAHPPLATARRFLPVLPTAGEAADAEPTSRLRASVLDELAGTPPGQRQVLVEQNVVDKVARVLGSVPDKIDPERPLPEMGFDSLMAVELVSAIKTEFAVRLPAVKVLQGSSARTLATAVLEALAIADAADADIDANAVAGARDADIGTAGDLATGSPQRLEEHPLSFEQRRLWFLHRLDPDDPAYNMSTAAALSGPLDVDALERSLRAAVQRHEVLRAAFRETDGEPVQVFAPRVDLPLPVIDLSGLPKDERAADLQRRALQVIRRPFDLSSAPPLRAVLFRLAPDEHLILLVVHHLACDAWSMNCFASELAALYGALIAGRPAGLPTPPFRYVDYVARERERLSDDLVADQLAYWRNRLAGAPAQLGLPWRRRPHSGSGRHGAHRTFTLSPSLTAALEDLSRRDNVTLFMTLLAGFTALLHRYTGSDDLCVATPVATRADQGAEAVMGCFMNTVVLRSDLSGDPTFRQLLQRVRTTTLEALEHQDVPFDRVVEAVQPDRGAGGNPLFEALLVLHNARLPELEIAGLELRPVDVESGTAVTDLAFLLDAGAQLRGVVEYDADRFDPTTIERMVGHFERLLRAAVTDPERRVSALPMLSNQERRQVLVEWNDTTVDLGAETCLHRLVEAHVERAANATAVVTEHGCLTYRELDERANQLAHHLRGRGVVPGAVVGVHLPRSLDTCVAALAVLKAGGAFLPLDLALPAARLAYLLSDAQVSMLVTTQPLLDALPPPGVPVVALDADGPRIAQQPLDSPAVSTTPDDLAYVIYTSGSLGEPKGVMVPHRAICNQVRWRQQAFPLSVSDAVLQSTPLGFDPSVWELFGPLTAGARLVVPPPSAEKDGAAVVRRIAEHDVTTLQVVPSALAALLEQPGVEDCRCLRRVFCGGEPLPADLVERFFTLLPAELHHLYGPTEAAIDTTHWACRRGDEHAVVPIGRPIANARVLLLDEHLEPVPVGVPGQLHIGGAGLSCGYRNRPSETAERFIADPFTPGERLYRSGDLARWLPDGTIAFVGRIDDQSKVRGYRVEPGEVEAVLARHPDVREAAVVAAASRLTAFVVADASTLTSAVRRYAAEQLPDYMVPSTVTLLDALPRTASGKVDRARLATRQNDEPVRTRIAPRDAVELELLHLWEDFFPGQHIGVTDDFFELGGHSLLAMRVIAQVQRAFGRQVPVSSLLEGRTIERLACLLRDEPTARSPVVAIQPRGSHPPVFWVHPLSGTVYCYVELAEALRNDRPCYGLQATGIVGEGPHTRIEHMACRYVEEVQRVQPAGPYLLGGWSMGGVVAFEMARQLEERGEKVELLALLDPPPPGAGADDETAAGEPLTSFVQHLGLSPNDLTVSAGGFWQLDPSEQLACVLEHARRAGLVPPDLEAAELDRQLAVFTSNLRALRDYIPKPYTGRVTLLEAAGSAHRSALCGDRWDDLTLGGLVRHTVPGDHHTMLGQPHVGVLAQRLTACLREAGASTA